MQKGSIVLFFPASYCVSSVLTYDFFLSVSLILSFQLGFSFPECPSKIVFIHTAQANEEEKNAIVFYKYYARVLFQLNHFLTAEKEKDSSNVYQVGALMRIQHFLST